MEPEEAKIGPQPAAEERVSRFRPLMSLLLLDVIRDRESRTVFIWAGSTLIFGALAYHWLEGWSYLDALYFSVVSLATVGYGDLAPKTPLGRAFTIFYIINGVVILLATFDRIRTVRAREMEARTRQRRGTPNASGMDQL
jgi:voltage-gated potassium channel